MSKFLPLLSLMIVLAAPAYAEPIPEAVLAQDFSSCMGGNPNSPDKERAAYCNCVRDGMRSWDLDTYGKVATEQSKASNAQQVPPMIEDLAKGCIAKVLK